MLLIGTFLNLKIIPIVRKDRDRVWLINVTRAVSAILLMIGVVIFERLMEHFPDLTDYTGFSVCYVAAFMYVYLPYMIIMETLFVSIIKYVFIVHTAKAMKYGEDKIEKRFFWINILHGLLPSIITVYLWDFEAYASLNSCFGLEERIQETYFNKNSPTGNLERMFMCKLRITDGEDLGRHISYMLAQSFCASKMVLNLVLMSNISEAYFYFKIFQKMKRYENRTYYFIMVLKLLHYN
jgi:hypothetical protein